MEENPYKATIELNKKQPRHRRARFGFLILGTLCGATAGGLLVVALMSIYADDTSPPNRFVPIICAVSLACLGAVGGAILEYFSRE